MEKIATTIKLVCAELFDVVVEPEISRPEEQFGDYTSNVSLRLANQLSKNPRDVGEQIVASLRDRNIYAKVEVAGPGFINIWLKDEQLAEMVSRATDLTKPLEGQEILVEFGDPNPFKEMHIGHLYSYIVGDSISNLLESAGATVRRLSYHGDVGLHVARAIYGLLHLEKELWEQGKKLDDVVESNPENLLGMAYAFGTQASEQDEAATSSIQRINSSVYAHNDPEVNRLYTIGRQLSFSAFDAVLQMLRVKTDKRYLESQTTPVGMKFVQDYRGRVFEDSDGAIVYKGEKVGLHTRVFITSRGLPTYETKDLGLAELKNQDFPNSSRSIIITANEQAEYFKVMLAALAEIQADLAAKTTHITHGFLSLTSGKMSSRSGQVYAAASLLDGVRDAINEQHPDAAANEQVYLAAVKYSLLKHRLGQDIVIDVNEAVSVDGNSGPYLAYAHARAKSILEKSTNDNPNLSPATVLTDFERSLARKISEFPETVARATTELAPHQICTYLYELAQTFNRFYENSRVIGDERQNIRLALVQKYAEVLKNGLSLLGIEAPDSM